MHIRATAGAIVMAVGLAGCVTTPPSEDPVLIKLTEIDQRLQKVERLTNNDSLVELASQLEEARREIRDLRGEVETLAHETQGASTRQRDQYVDIDRRLQSLLKDARYTEARKEFELFMADHPTSDLAGHSQYWLGETYYVTQQFEQALPEFQKVLESYPDSRKLPDAMLKVGYCHYELGQYQQASAQLSRVVQQYPESTAARLAAQRLDRMKSEGR
jgi:tol-pal system protein YbgF